MIMHIADPFQTLLALQRSLDAARASNWFGMQTTSTGSFPSINVFRQGEDFLLVAELPGVDKNDLDVQVKSNQVRIAGKKVVSYDDNLSVHRRERADGEFDRTLQFPAEIDAARVKAEYRNGILAVSLPRAESDKPRSITVN